MNMDSLLAMRGYSAGSLPTRSAAGILAPQKQAEGFGSIFSQVDSATQGYANGTIGAQSVVEALSQAEMALQTAVTVRDRLVGAYQELLRMPL